MHYFEYHEGELWCEGVRVAQLAATYGTPLYLYSQATLERHAQVFREAFAEIPHQICFAVKANSNQHILRLLAAQGLGADIVSGGELLRAQRAGIAAEHMVFAGVGKRDDEIRMGLEAGVQLFNVESLSELERIDAIAREMGIQAPVALRVNPDVDARTHPYISTGLRENKFGIGMDDALEAYRRAQGMAHINVRGVHCHIGSQLTQIEPFVDTVRIISDLIAQLRAEGIAIDVLDLGGGLGIPYDDEQPPLPRQLAEAIVPLVRDLGCELIFEPGRVLAGNAGIFLTRVLHRKTNGEKRFLIVDGAMNDLARPTLYGSYHDILPVVRSEAQLEVADVVGPICETGDFFARDRQLPVCQPGDVLALMSAGAYGFTMSSNYNSRPRCAEVMVSGEHHRLIRRRETIEDILRPEEELA